MPRNFRILVGVLLLGGATAHGQSYGTPGAGAYGSGAGSYSGGTPYSGLTGPQSGYSGATDQDAAAMSRLPPVATDGMGGPGSAASPGGFGPAQGSAPFSDQDLASSAGRAGVVWTVQADALGLTRNVGSSTFLGQTSALGVGPAIQTLNANDASFNLVPGMRLALSATVDDQVSYEVLYFGLQNWSASNTILADPIAGTLATSPYTQTDKLTGGFDKSLGYSYTSKLNNAEFNVRRIFHAGNWALAPLVGFRYFQWNETLSLTGVDQFYGVTENLNSVANNYLVGGQIGGTARRDWQRFSLAATGKAGVFANFMQLTEANLNSTGIAGLPGTGFVSLNSDSRHAGAAGMLDFSAVATYHVTQHFSVRGGYQLVYVTGLALAPNQFAGFSHTGGLLLQGPTAGLEFTW